MIEINNPGQNLSKQEIDVFQQVLRINGIYLRKPKVSGDTCSIKSKTLKKYRMTTGNVAMLESKLFLQ